jgi:hypothetical protein
MQRQRRLSWLWTLGELNGSKLRPQLDRLQALVEEGLEPGYYSFFLVTKAVLWGCGHGLDQASESPYRDLSTQLSYLRIEARTTALR